MLENIEAIERYTHDMDESTFVGSGFVVDAVERCFRRLCEAARKLDNLAEDLAPDQPWKKIRDLGNILRHDYDVVERKDLWGIVTDDLPSLKAACRRVLATLGEPE